MASYIAMPHICAKMMVSSMKNDLTWRDRIQIKSYRVTVFIKPINFHIINFTFFMWMNKLSYCIILELNNKSVVCYLIDVLIVTCDFCVSFYWCTKITAKDKDFLSLRASTSHHIALDIRDDSSKPFLKQLNNNTFMP